MSAHPLHSCFQLCRQHHGQHQVSQAAPGAGVYRGRGGGGAHLPSHLPGAPWRQVAPRAWHSGPPSTQPSSLPACLPGRAWFSSRRQEAGGTHIVAQQPHLPAGLPACLIVYACLPALSCLPACLVSRASLQETGGTYSVATGESHLEQLVLAHAVPPPAVPGSAGVSLVKMGFPAKNPEAPGTAAFIGGHVGGRGGGGWPLKCSVPRELGGCCTPNSRCCRHCCYGIGKAAGSSRQPCLPSLSLSLSLSHLPTGHSSLALPCRPRLLVTARRLHLPPLQVAHGRAAQPLPRVRAAAGGVAAPSPLLPPLVPSKGLSRSGAGGAAGGRGGWPAVAGFAAAPMHWRALAGAQPFPGDKLKFFCPSCCICACWG